MWPFWQLHKQCCYHPRNPSWKNKKQPDEGTLRLGILLAYTITARQITELSPSVNTQSLRKPSTYFNVLPYKHQKSYIATNLGPNSRYEEKNITKHVLIMEVAISDLTMLGWYDDLQCMWKGQNGRQSILLRLWLGGCDKVKDLSHTHFGKWP